MTTCDEFVTFKIFVTMSKSSFETFHLHHGRSEVPIHSKEKSPPRPRTFSQHSFVATKKKISRRTKKMIFREIFTMMKFLWNRFYEILEKILRKFYEDERNVKKEKKREKNEEGIWTEKIFWSSWEKRVNFKWFDPFSKRTFFEFFLDSRNKNSLRPSRGMTLPTRKKNRGIRRNENFSKMKREIFFRWWMYYSDWWLIFNFTKL